MPTQTVNADKTEGVWRRLLSPWRTHRGHIVLASAGILLILAGTAFFFVRRSIVGSWPQVTGSREVKGLGAAVTVVRDGYGVPHVFADSQRDWLFAQGYLHAQDRFWGMELQRRRGHGTLGALLGEEARAADERWAALHLAEITVQEVDALNPTARARLDAYVAGVNAWLEQDRLPFEFTLLRWRGRDVADPAPWTAEDSLLVALVLSWQAGGPQVDPAVVSQVNQQVGSQRGAFLWDADGSNTSGVRAWAQGLPFQPSFAGEDGGPAFWPERWSLGSRVAQTEGSSWFAVQLPAGLDLPAPWYVLTWHAGVEVGMGVSVPGVPGLVLAADDLAAWATGEATDNRDAPWKGWLLSSLMRHRTVLTPALQPSAQTVQEIQAWLNDTFSMRAAHLVPYLVELKPQGWRQVRVTGMLRQWNYRFEGGGKEVAFFAVYQLELARATFADELGDDLFNGYVAHGDYYQRALDRIIEDAGSPWWDDLRTPERETRADILQRAYDSALAWIGRRYGDLHLLWEWDMVHGGELQHALGDVWPWRALLNRAISPQGWADTIDASPGGLSFSCPGLKDVLKKDEPCLAERLFQAASVYGYGQIVNLDDPSTLWFSLVPGQSDHVFNPHYDDLLSGWAEGKYLPLQLVPAPDQVAGQESTLVLTPGN
jgi:acyl-homoserine lactone acylase PvdQ